MTLRAVSLVAGGWPSGGIIAEIIKNKEWSVIPYYYWLYLGGIIVLAIVSCIIQYNGNKEEDKDNLTKNGKSYHGMA